MTKKQHYVPQVYLRNFLTASNELFVYDRQKSMYFRCRSQDICREDYLYETLWENAISQLGKYVLPNQIENAFSGYEGVYGTLLRKLINVCSEPQNKTALICNADDKRALASLAVNMLVRNPWSLNQVNADKLHDGVMENEEIQSISQLFRLWNWGEITSLIKASNKKVCLDEKLAGGVPAQLISELLNLNFSILISEKHPFVTSSFPVAYEIYDSEDGMTHLKMLYLPIHPRFALMYSNNIIAKPYRNRMVSLPVDKVKRMNQLYFQSDIEQTRYIIASDESILKYIAN